MIIGAGAVISLYVVGRDAWKEKLGWASAAKALLGAGVVADGVYLQSADASTGQAPIMQTILSPSAFVKPLPASQYVPRAVTLPALSLAEKKLHPDVFVTKDRADVRTIPGSRVAAQASCGTRLPPINEITGNWNTFSSPDGTFFMLSASLSATKPTACRPG